MKAYILSLVALVCACATAFAGSKDKLKEYYNAYNVKRGIELYTNGDYQSAKSLFEKELETHSENGYAHFYIAMLNEQNYSLAIDSYNKAIKYLKGDTYWLCFAYRNRGKIYNSIGHKDKAIKDFNTAVTLDTKDPLNYLERGNYYYFNKQYDLSDKDYEMLNVLNVADVYGYTGRGRNAIARGEYKEAVNFYNKAEKLHGNPLHILPFRAEAYIGLNNYFKAAADVIQSFVENGSDKKANEVLDKLCIKGYNALMINIKAQMLKEKDRAYWPWLMARVNEKAHHYTEAIECYKQTQDLNAQYDFSYEIADCYVNIGKLDAAMSYINRAIASDTTLAENYYQRSYIYYLMNDKEKALADCDLYMAYQESTVEGYLLRGYYELNFGLFEQAYSDLMYVHTHAPENSDIRLTYIIRAAHAHGDQEGMTAIANSTIDLYMNDKCDAKDAMYAYAYLGDADKAIEVLNDKIVNKDNFYHYDAACLYSILGNLDKSLEYLKIAYDTDFTSFNHARHDYDLVNVRQRPEFEQLTKEYEAKLDRTIADDKVDNHLTREHKVSEIPFTRENGVCKVKCTLNGLPLYFIFDTGASDVSISNIEASFMFKNEYLSKRDITGKQSYSDANGDISVGTVINISDVKFGDLTLNNVKASVVNNQKAPLLLGQSVLSRLGRIEIDNENMVIRITQ